MIQLRIDEESIRNAPPEARGEDGSYIIVVEDVVPVEQVALLCVALRNAIDAVDGVKSKKKPDLSKERALLDAWTKV